MVDPRAWPSSDFRKLSFAKKKAAIALARKIAVVAWAMLKNKTDWDPAKAGILTTVQECPSNAGSL